MRRHIERALVTGMIAALLYLPSFSRLQQLKIKDQELAQKLQQVVRKNHLLAEENDMLQNDPEYIEATAREKLKVTKKNEIILRVIDEPALP